MMLKIIGVFCETDGEEFENMAELVKTKGLIGSTSADVGHVDTSELHYVRLPMNHIVVELYYDDLGNTYAVAHDAEKYYGKKSDSQEEIRNDENDGL